MAYSNCTVSPHTHFTIPSRQGAVHANVNKSLHILCIKFAQAAEKALISFILP